MVLLRLRDADIPKSVGRQLRGSGIDSLSFLDENSVQLTPNSDLEIRICPLNCRPTP